jgi:hypothetical protein
MARTGRTISDVVREIMASLPETEEFVSHGALTFRVRGKFFASYTINHHGDGRVALNLMAPPGAQAAFTKMRLKQGTGGPSGTQPFFCAGLRWAAGLAGRPA